MFITRFESLVATAVSADKTAFERPHHAVRF